MENLQNILYDRMQKEQAEYITGLENSTPRQVIDSAYELVMRNDILISFENNDFEAEQISELLKLEYPLSACYDAWLKADCSHMDMLKDTIDDFSNGLVKNRREKEEKRAEEMKSVEKAAKRKKRHEPER